jgi:hypothetical protein
MVPDNQGREQNNKDASVKPDKETLHKTDPQENMTGPVSSPMKQAGKAFDTNESKQEADEEKDRKL